MAREVPLEVLWFRGPLGRLHAFLAWPTLDEVSQCGKAGIDLMGDEPERGLVCASSPSVCQACAVVVFPQRILTYAD